MSERISGCRSCDSPLMPVLSLGEMPLANALLTAQQLNEPEPVFPLELAFCSVCTLLQITVTVPPAELFREYVYFSSYSDDMVRQMEALARRLVQRESLTPASLVIEAASNDGYLLQHYKRLGIPVLGIEPAVNVAEVARRERGIPTLAEFFGVDVAERLAADAQTADVFHANNVLAHVADLNGFVAGIRAVLKPEGLAVIETPYVRDLLDKCEFDTIYHEHLCYYSLTALDRLFRRNGLVVAGVERFATHGGSLRVFVAREGSGRRPDPAVERLLAEEAAWGVELPATYHDFARRTGELQAELRRFLAGLRSAGATIAAYGAAAKGSTLLNCCGIGTETLDFVVDRSPHKQGRYLPGVHIPVRAPEDLLGAQPDYALLLTWNFADEILQQQAEYRRRGGKFILPVPRVQVV